jgi:hypothetical protein
MTAQLILDVLEQLREEGHDLSNISINFRKDMDSDVHVCHAIEEDLFDEETNNKLRSLMLLSDPS